MMKAAVINDKKTEIDRAIAKAEAELAAGATAKPARESLAALRRKHFGN